MTIKRPSIFLQSLAFGTLYSAVSALASLTIHFGDVNLDTPPAQNYTGPGGGVYYNGSDSAGGFSSGGAFFVNDYSTLYGSWNGWAYSTTEDSTTAGFLNQWSAYAGQYMEGRAYAVAHDPTGGGFGSPPVIQLPTGFDVPLSARLTNATYAFDSMLNGDGFARKFGDGDWFLLTITGKDGMGGITGVVDFYLADYRDGQTLLIDEWVQVDLSLLGSGVANIEFQLSSSDVGAWGMNTPAYFALAELSVVPEPSTYALLFALAAGLFVMFKRRR